MKLSHFKDLKWKWYHFVVFALPGGMFFLSIILAYEVKKNARKRR